MKPTHRFTNRAEDYRRHRPDYSAALLTFPTSQIPPDEAGDAPVCLRQGEVTVAFRLLASEGTAYLR